MQEFLANHDVKTVEEVNAKKKRYQRDEALGLLDGIRKLFVVKSRKLHEFDLNKDRPDDDTIARLILGPTGNLRAPVLRKGKTLVVGYDEAMCEKVFG